MIVANAIWAVDSIILLLSMVTPNALGYAFIIFQALVVAAFAEIQYIGIAEIHDDRRHDG